MARETYDISEPTETTMRYGLAKFVVSTGAKEAEVGEVIIENIKEWERLDFVWTVPVLVH